MRVDLVRTQIGAGAAHQPPVITGLVYSHRVPFGIKCSASSQVQHVHPAFAMPDDEQSARVDGLTNRVSRINRSLIFEVDTHFHGQAPAETGVVLRA